MFLLNYRVIFICSYFLFLCYFICLYQPLLVKRQAI